MKRSSGIQHHIVFNVYLSNAEKEEVSSNGKQNKKKSDNDDECVLNFEFHQQTLSIDHETHTC